MDGFALLGSHLGDPDRRILTDAGIRTLTRRMETFKTKNPDRELSFEDLLSLGYGKMEGDQILCLLKDGEQLRIYLQQGKKANCHLLTRADQNYPLSVRKRLGGESPCCLFYKGNPDILKNPMVSLVGSRDLREENWAFAREAGRQAAIQGLTLVSGNARGADRTAQEACLEAGGTVVSIVADTLFDKKENENILYLSQQDYDAAFSSLRALSRNRVIHAMGSITLAAQCSLNKGGTWSGTTQNLQKGWSAVACYNDGSEAAMALSGRGAILIGMEDLKDLRKIRDPQIKLF